MSYIQAWMRKLYGHIEYKIISRLKDPPNQFCELKSALFLVDSYTQHLFELQGLVFLLEQKLEKHFLSPI